MILLKKPLDYRKSWAIQVLLHSNGQEKSSDNSAKLFTSQKIDQMMLLLLIESCANKNIFLFLGFLSANGLLVVGWLLLQWWLFFRQTRLFLPFFYISSSKFDHFFLPFLSIPLFSVTSINDKDCVDPQSLLTAVSLRIWISDSYSSPELQPEPQWNSVLLMYRNNRKDVSTTETKTQSQLWRMHNCLLT